MEDFYELCRARMNPKGIMQQWIQIHHIDTIDLLTVIKSMHSVFPHLAFFIGGGQGILVGSMSPLEVDYQKMAKLGGDARIVKNVAPIGFPADDIFSVLSNIYLYEENLADALQAEPSAAISSDWNPALEYTTPKGNQLPYAILANKEFLDLKRYQDLPRVINAPEDKLNYLRGLVAFQRKHFRALVIVSATNSRKQV